MGMFDFLEEETLMPEDANNYTTQVVQEGQMIAEKNHWGDKYPMLMAGLESSDPDEQYRNAYTSILMRNQAQFVQRSARQYGESTVNLAA